MLESAIAKETPERAGTITTCVRRMNPLFYYIFLEKIRIEHSGPSHSHSHGVDSNIEKMFKDQQRRVFSLDTDQVRKEADLAKVKVYFEKLQRVVILIRILLQLLMLTQKKL